MEGIMYYSQLIDQLADEISRDVYKITRAKLQKFEGEHFEFREPEPYESWLGPEGYEKIKTNVTRSERPGLKKIIKKYGLKLDHKKYKDLPSLRVAILEKILLTF
jgi:hypothetical protein